MNRSPVLIHMNAQAIAIQSDRAESIKAVLSFEREWLTRRIAVQPIAVGVKPWLRRSEERDERRLCSASDHGQPCVKRFARAWVVAWFFSRRRFLAYWAKGCVASAVNIKNRCTGFLVPHFDQRTIVLLFEEWHSSGRQRRGKQFEELLACWRARNRTKSFFYRQIEMLLGVAQRRRAVEVERGMASTRKVNLAFDALNCAFLGPAVVCPG